MFFSKFFYCIHELYKLVLKFGASLGVKSRFALEVTRINQVFLFTSQLQEFFLIYCVVLTNAMGNFCSSQN